MDNFQKELNTKYACKVASSYIILILRLPYKYEGI